MNSPDFDTTYLTDKLLTSNQYETVTKKPTGQKKATRLYLTT